jgi:cysteine desulfurase
MSKLPIYMDNHATTPLDPRVLEAMMPYFKEDFGNPASTDHPYGARAAEAVEHAREQVAKAINAKPQEIIFTSGATEADNLAIQGVAGAASTKPAHIITCTTEHKSVLETCRSLGKSGCRMTYTPVDEYGVIDLNRLESSIIDSTALISVMFANNEIGTIAPVAEIGKIAKEHGVLFHTDAAQAVGHVPVDVDAQGIDLMSMSAHKVYGPKGIGALYLRGRDPRVRLTPMVAGGGQEKGLRPGTLNVPGIVGMGRALEIATREMSEESERLAAWTRKMRSAFESTLGAEPNGHPSQRLPHNLNMFFRGVESKALIQSVNSQLAISASSACTTDQVQPSHVILALGLGPERAHCSVRFGLGRFNTEEEVDFAIETIDKAVRRLLAIKA